MSDKIPMFKKEIDDIPVPVDKLDTIITKAVQKGIQKRKKPNKKKLMLSVGAAVATLALLIGSATVSPVMANIVSQIPVLNSIFSESGDLGLKQVSELGLTQVVGESKTVKGNTITIDEVFFDGTRLTVGYSLTSEKPLGEFYLNNGMNVTIDGKKFSFGGNSEETEITPTFRRGIYNIEPSDIVVPEEFKLGLSFEGEGGERWKFFIPVNKQSGAKFVTIDETQQVGGVGLNISALEISPVGLRITYNTVAKENEFLSGAYIKFKAVDSSGNELAISSEGGGHSNFINGNIYTIGNSLFEPIDENVTELTITPYLDLSSGGGVEFDEDGNEVPIDFELQKGEKIKFESFTVTLP
ncbi:DUF4179 domain-containing protein [Sporosarcina saromensis]|uniref:DUF4179 domain-containing protein n=1 Tax=Sporosarcina saromensis TaxID=359365 RepID=A0ABU4G4T5_9BACL|nr:DUF4179 domain-containing protein [Sporosarcina saromensis]MDW0111973.1 DUF4179 domain-containing protein [Sporosarcina saromensis]